MLNFQPIIDAALEAFIATNEELGEIFQAGVPVRTGTLKDSYNVEYPDLATAVQEWTADYALYVHEDITMHDGKPREGKHWTVEGLSQAQDIYNAQISKLL